MKIIAFILGLLYVISPIDLMPMFPVDDIIVIILDLVYLFKSDKK